VRAALFDIEGTTTSIAFVYETLFPYARAALPAFIAARWDDPDVRAACTLMGADDSPEGAATRALALMDRDAKDTGLKALQGLVWADGYGLGEIEGHLFADVPKAFQALHARGVAIAIYSSGSVVAQKLLFGRSVAGDLSPLVSGWFDTTTGPKKEAASYRTIAERLGVAPAEVTFYTDQMDEARAARAAGMAAVIIRRPGNAPVPELAPGEALFPVHDDLGHLLSTEG